ncbi:MAG TPA: tetratricopeptide repeat protein, partial [Ktedonobacteraceae bacterium]|nr:tetratricopeptide repeat protein [Ktedonobacteraceae bacterium]
MVALTLPSVILKYLRLLVAPYPLALFYDIPYVLKPGWNTFWLPCLLLLASAVILGWLMFRGGRLAKFAVAFLVLPILPPLDLPVLPLNEVVHDRYLYLPTIGLALLAGLGWQRIKSAPDASRPLPWRAPLIVSLAFVLAMLTAVQSLPWVNNLVLYADCVRHAPGLPVVHNNMGNELSERGRYPEAIEQYQQALKILPNYWFGIFNL